MVIHDMIHIQFCWLHWTVNVLSICPYRTNKGHQTNSWLANLLDLRTFFMYDTPKPKQLLLKKKRVKASVKSTIEAMLH